MTVSLSGSKATSATATSVRFDANNTLLLSGTNQVTLTNGAGFTWKFDALGRLTCSAQGSASGGAIQLGGGEAHLYSGGAGVFGVGNGTLSLLEINGTNPDSDQTLQVGRLRFDSRSTDVAFASHRDMTTTTNYCWQQNSLGASRFNAASGQTLTLRVNNSQKFIADGTGIAFYTTGAGVAQQTVTGSKGANAALGSLMTALAALGLVIDSTT
jgi:hypothetical protein